MDLFFDFPTREYRFAWREGIGVEYVYTNFLAGGEPPSEGNYYQRKLGQIDQQVNFISLVKVIRSLGEEEQPIKTLREIREYISTRYKPLNIDQIAIIYHHYYPRRHQENPEILRKLKYQYKPSELVNKYRQLQQKIQEYPQILDKATHALEQVQISSKEGSVRVSVPEITNKQTIFQFSSNLTPEQFFELDHDPKVIYISYHHRSKVSLDLTQKELSQIAQEDQNGYYLLIRFGQSILRVTMDWETRVITVKDNISVMITQIQDFLRDNLIGITSLIILKSQDYIGNFDIDYSKFSNISFSHLATVDPRYRSFFYIDEKDDPSSLRGERSVYHVNSLAQYYDLDRYQRFKKNQSIIRFSIKLIRNISGSMIHLPDGKKKYQYAFHLRVNFNHAKDIKAIYLLRRYLEVLFEDYTRELPSIRRWYRQIIPGIDDQVLKTKKKSIVGETRIKRLNDVFEKVYQEIPKNYSTRCSLDRQPKVISESEVEEVKEYPNRYRGLVDPKTGRKYYLYCDKRQYPDLHIKDKYPCCFKRGSKPKKDKNRVLKYLKWRKVPPMVDAWLNVISPGTYYQLGSSFSNYDSFYGCVLDIIKGKKTQATPGELKNFKKEILGQLRRQKFALPQDPTLSNQEIEEILSSDYIPDENSPPPSVFYSVIESLYSASIFVIEEKGETYQFETYSKYPYYIRLSPKTFEGSILLYKYLSDDIYRYEIIGRFPLGREPSKSSLNQLIIYHSSSFTQELYRAWYHQFNNYLVSPIEGVIRRYHNPHRTLDYSGLVVRGKKKPREVFQIIDHYDKVRMVIFKHQETYFKIATLPTNYHPDLGEVRSFDWSQKIPEPPYWKVINYFQYYPVGVTLGLVQDWDKVIGLWYSFGSIIKGYYCSVLPVKISQVRSHLPRETLERTYPLPFSPNEYISEIERNFFLQVISHNILTVVSYLYSISGESLESFKKRFQVKSTLRRGRDTSEIYYSLVNPPKIDLRIKKPSLSTYRAEAKKLTSTNLISGEKIQCYSQRMKDGLIYYLENYDRDLEYNESNLRFKDFEASSYAVLKDRQELRDWTRSQERYQIHSELNKVFDQPKKDPWIYREEERFYLVQMVDQNDFYRSIKVALYWYQHKINLGFYSEPYRKLVGGYNQIPATYFITMDRGGKLVFPEDDLAQYLLILYQRPTRFAAILPI